MSIVDYAQESQERPSKLKVKWEFVPTPDAQARIEAAFDIIFNRLGENSAGDLSEPIDLNFESPDGEDQQLSF